MRQRLEALHEQCVVEMRLKMKYRENDDVDQISSPGSGDRDGGSNEVAVEVGGSRSSEQFPNNWLRESAFVDGRRGEAPATNEKNILELSSAGQAKLSHSLHQPPRLKHEMWREEMMTRFTRISPASHTGTQDIVRLPRSGPFLRHDLVRVHYLCRDPPVATLGLVWLPSDQNKDRAFLPPEAHANLGP